MKWIDANVHFVEKKPNTKKPNNTIELVKD